MEPTIKIQKVTADPNLVRFTVQSFDELFREGIGPDGGSIGWHWTYEAVVGYWADEIVGAILFDLPDKGITLSVCHGFVRPEYRKLGIYTQLWNALVKEARKREARNIWSATHLRNSAMRNFWAKHGRQESFVSGYYYL
jgi:GNAT superfamily N-acetyltransferase